MHVWTGLNPDWHCSFDTLAISHLVFHSIQGDQEVFSALESLGSTIALEEIHPQEMQAMTGWQATSHANPV